MCLEEHQLTPSKITMFNTPSAKKLYLLHFNADVNMKSLEPIKYVYHHVIAWLPFKPERNGPKQCHKCLMTSCHRYTVCMLCAGKQFTKDCPNNNNSTNNINQTFTCFNCKSANLQHNHKANAVDCPFRLKYEHAKNNARTKSTTNKQMNTNALSFVPAPTPPPQHSSYADTARAQHKFQLVYTRRPFFVRPRTNIVAQCSTHEKKNSIMRRQIGNDTDA